MHDEKKEKHSNTSRIRAEEKEFERKRSVKRTGNKRKIRGITEVKDEQKHITEEHKKKRTKHKRNMVRITGGQDNRNKKLKYKNTKQKNRSARGTEQERNGAPRGT
jgi:hypothetical protein